MQSPRAVIWSIFNMMPVQGFFKDQRYVFGIQAQTFGQAPFDLRSDTLLGRAPRPVIDQGQTVFELISTGLRLYPTSWLDEQAGPSFGVLRCG